jgi:hypothetical protein
MKLFAITSILALSIAAPVLAQTQLERSVGAEAGQYTLSELATLHGRASETGNDGRSYFGYSNYRISTSNVHNATAARIFAQLAEESRGEGR